MESWLVVPTRSQPQQKALLRNAQMELACMALPEV